MRLTLLLALTVFAHAEDRSMSLGEAIGRALHQNPEVVLARLEEQKAALAIRASKDPFFPKTYIGSGLAYTSGFPMSIEGSAPSVVQARAIASVFNRPYSHRIAQTVEQARAAGMDTEARRNEAAHRTALLYIDAARWRRTAVTLRRQWESLDKAEQAIRERVDAGRELEVEAKRAALAAARAKQRLQSSEEQADYLSSSLALVLGYSAEDRILPGSGDSPALTLPASEEDSVAAALDRSQDLKKIASAIVAKGHEVRSYKAERLPSADLVAQYGMFARFNNYEDFFRTFRRHNWQLGVSVQVPVLPSRASLAQAAQGDIEVTRLKTQLDDARNRIVVETRRSFREVAAAERARDVARLALDVAREQVNVVLAQTEEGRAGLRQLEEARAAEQERWVEYYDAQFAVERAKLDLLNQAGLLASAAQ